MKSQFQKENEKIERQLKETQVDPSLKSSNFHKLLFISRHGWRTIYRRKLLHEDKEEQGRIWKKMKKWLMRTKRKMEKRTRRKAKRETKRQKKWKIIQMELKRGLCKKNNGL